MSDGVTPFFAFELIVGGKAGADFGVGSPRPSTFAGIWLQTAFPPTRIAAAAARDATAAARARPID
jgi:hypothetical protein